MNIIIPFILACNVHAYKFKTKDINENLAFVKCYHDMSQCYKWNKDINYCVVLLEEL